MLHAVIDQIAPQRCRELWCLRCRMLFADEHELRWRFREGGGP
jgi:hypothetical protein